MKNMKIIKKNYSEKLIEVHVLDCSNNPEVNTSMEDDERVVTICEQIGFELDIQEVNK